MQTHTYTFVYTYRSKATSVWAASDAARLSITWVPCRTPMFTYIYMMHIRPKSFLIYISIYIYIYMYVCIHIYTDCQSLESLVRHLCLCSYMYRVYIRGLRWGSYNEHKIKKWEGVKKNYLYICINIVLEFNCRIITGWWQWLQRICMHFNNHLCESS
jgi:hypothetical protein